MNSLNDVNTYLSEAFRSKFEDYFLADENGEPRHRSELRCDREQFFRQGSDALPLNFQLQSLTSFEAELGLICKH